MRYAWSLLCLFAACSAVAAPPTTWRSVGPGGGGSLFAPTFSPFNQNQITLACDMSGQYTSTTNGLGWLLTPFTTIQMSGNSSDVGYTSDPNTIYSIDFSNNAQTPVVSKNGGKSYTQVPNDPTQGGAWYLFSDKSTTTRLFTTDYADLYFSKDGGNTWSTVVTGNNNAGIVVGGAFFDGSRILVGTSLGVYVSNNGGLSFALSPATGIPSSEAIVGFSVAKTGTTTRLFAVTLQASQVYGGMGGDNCYAYMNTYTMDYGASSWTKRETGLPSSDYFFFVKTSLNDINTAYLGGTDGNGFPCVYKTVNGGQSWSNALLTANDGNILAGWQGWGGDRGWGFDGLCFGLAVAPTNSQRVAFTGMGFCHISTDGGVLWHQAYVTPATQNPVGQRIVQGKSYQGVGLENTSCWTLAWSDVNDIWAGFTDIIGVRSNDAGNTWNFNYTGDSYNTCYQTVKAASGTLYSAVSNTHDMYESTHLTDGSIDGGSGAVLTSTDKGHTWTPVGALGPIAIGVALDPTNSKRLYATAANSSTGGVYVCQDVTKGVSAVWSKLTNPPRTQGHADNIYVLKGGTLVCTFSGRRASNFTNSSGVFVSTNGGASWVDRSSPNMLYWTRDLTVDPTDSTQNTWYVAVYSGWGGLANNKGGIYKTVDRGLHWTTVLLNEGIGSVTVNPNNGNEVYAATEINGLYYCGNAKSASPTFSATTYPFMHPQRIFYNPFKPNEIWVISFGNGLRVGTAVSG